MYASLSSPPILVWLAMLIIPPIIPPMLFAIHRSFRLGVPRIGTIVTVGLLSGLIGAAIGIEALREFERSFHDYPTYDNGRLVPWWESYAVSLGWPICVGTVIGVISAVVTLMRLKRHGKKKQSDP
jgi:hypothetical protein